MHSAKLASGWARKKDIFDFGGCQQEAKYAGKQRCSTQLQHEKEEFSFWQNKLHFKCKGSVVFGELALDCVAKGSPLQLCQSVCVCVCVSHKDTYIVLK